MQIFFHHFLKQAKLYCVQNCKYYNGSFFKEWKIRINSKICILRTSRFCKTLDSRAANEELPDILQEEGAYSFLEEGGYHGVPARETKESIENVVRWVYG